MSIWGESNEEPLSERELLAEQEVSSVPIIEYDAIPQHEAEQIQEDSSYDLEEPEIEIAYNARIRLEQAKLYEMLIDHDIFEGVEANAQAISNVKTELKQYILERLEVLLGIKTEKKVKSIQYAQKVELPFNALEIQFIKDLAYQGTKGESGNVTEAAQLDVTVGEAAKPVGPKPLAPKKLVNRPKPIFAKAEAAPVTEVEKPAVKAPPVTKAAPTVKARPTVAPKPRGRPPKTQSNEVYETVTEKVAEKIVKNEIAQIAGKPFDQIPPSELKAIKQKMISKKDFDEMNEAEKQAEIDRVNAKYRKPTAANARPMPSQEEINSIVTAQQMRNEARGGGDMGRFNNLVTNIILNKKAQQGE
jgi:hypothetical protein